MPLKKSYTFILFLLFFFINNIFSQSIIDRFELVNRHNIILNGYDSLSSLTVGNGEFAYTVDITGMQTFPEYYEYGIPLGTQSQWGWHSFIDTSGFSYEETYKDFDFHNRKVKYPIQWDEPERKKHAANWFRKNPHRLHLGIIGLDIINEDGIPISLKEINEINQELNLWTGEIISRFKINGVAVQVNTVCHQELDALSFKIKSELIKRNQLKIKFRFAYPTGMHSDMGCDWSVPKEHQTIINSAKNNVTFTRILDDEKYYINVELNKRAEISENEKHYFILSPDNGRDEFELSVHFSKNENHIALPSFTETKDNSLNKWKNFWEKGGAVDFSECTDTRASELERRIILSQYLTAIQCAGSLPPQETGLTYNSWFGKFHLEMHWWHGVHFALWNRIELLEKSLDWYKKIYNSAKEIADKQGYEGIRWPKMTDPLGIDSPSSIGPFLIWQQPHFIYFAELCYRQYRDKETLEKYKDLVFATAEFMASYAFYEEENDRFILGKGIISAQERFDPEKTFNTPFELSYWHWGLSTALKWCDRLGLERKKEWEEVLSKLSSLPQKKGLYLAAESAPDSYTNPFLMTDHPAVLGAYGMIPGNELVDTLIMKNTFNFIFRNWQWEDTWGWDFPLTAMAATRLNLPEKAVDALFMNVQTNRFLINGHNYQNERLRLYLPGNGGLLSAVAMMCAGFDGNNKPNPGFPKNGKWNVKWEGLKPIF